MCISNIGTIELEGMQFFAFHGVLLKREEGNLFIVDFKGKYDISAAMVPMTSDTLDYGKSII